MMRWMDRMDLPKAATDSTLWVRFQSKLWTLGRITASKSMRSLILLVTTLDRSRYDMSQSEHMTSLYHVSILFRMFHIFYLLEDDSRSIPSHMDRKLRPVTRLTHPRETLALLAQPQWMQAGALGRSSSNDLSPCGQGP